jgi:hypothetical protein
MAGLRYEDTKRDVPSTDRLVVFDEAQRASDLYHNVKFMSQKKGNLILMPQNLSL